MIERIWMSEQRRREAENECRIRLINLREGYLENIEELTKKYETNVDKTLRKLVETLEEINRNPTINMSRQLKIYKKEQREQKIAEQKQ